MNTCQYVSSLSLSTLSHINQECVLDQLSRIQERRSMQIEPRPQVNNLLFYLRNNCCFTLQPHILLYAAKDYDRAIKCFFVCTESLADIDLCDPEFKVFIRAQAARCHIMHLHTVQSMAKFASRYVP